MARSRVAEGADVVGRCPDSAESNHPAPPPPLDPLDLVLDRDELEMLEVFHRSFNLPGLRHNLLKPICHEDYFPTEEDCHEPSAAEQLQILMKRTTELKLEADEVLEEAIEDEEDVEQPLTMESRPSSAAPVRSIRRPTSGSQQPARSGARPPRR